MNEIDRLTKILVNLRKNNEKEKDLAFHYFIIKYANHLMGFNKDDFKTLLQNAQIGDGESYLTEISKMLKLSKYVSIKQDM